MELGYMIGWLGVALGLCVPIPQLIKILRTGKTDGISLMTYSFLTCALACYLWHAIHIQSIVFIVAQSVNLVSNGIILVLLIRGRRKL